MKTIHPDSFALLCFLTLMQNGEGLIDKSPDYITEKTYMLRSGHNSFAALDIYNMRKVIDYCNAWNIQVPSDVALEMERQNEAQESLKEKGFEI